MTKFFTPRDAIKMKTGELTATQMEALVPSMSQDDVCLALYGAVMHLRLDVVVAILEKMTLENSLSKLQLSDIRDSAYMKGVTELAIETDKNAKPVRVEDGVEVTTLSQELREHAAQQLRNELPMRKEIHALIQTEIEKRYPSICPGFRV